MALIECKECKKQISNTAETCPHCGKKQPKKLSVIHWIGIVVFGICGLVIAFGDKPSQSASAQTPTQQEQPQAQPQQSTKPIQVKISQLLSDYKDNEVNADNIYKGRVIHTSGIIGDIKKDITDSLYVTVGTGSEFEIPVLQAFFDDEHNMKLAKLKKGKKITVECQVDGLMMNIIGRECILK